MITRKPIKIKSKKKFLFTKKHKKSTPDSSNPSTPFTPSIKPKSTSSKRLIYQYRIKACNSNQPRFKELAKQHNIEFTTNPSKAHVIYSSRSRNLMTMISNFPKKKFIVFTHEPYFDKNRQKTINYLGKKVRIINCYTGYYQNIYYYFPSNARPLPYQDPYHLPSEEAFNRQKRKTCILASFHQDLIGSTKECLCDVRNRLGIYGHKLNVTDIYGKGWPRGYSKENSRKGKWKARKMDILKPYYFNICFENSYIKNYVSEKLWDAIRGFTLPIYKGSPWIYQIFPKNSFLDYNDFNNPKELYQVIEKMTYPEWCRRMNACLKVYNNILKTVNLSQVKDSLYHNFIQAILAK